MRAGFNHFHNWFARRIEDARAVGGPVVLGVEFVFDKEDDRDEQDRWQICAHEFIPSEQVCLVSREERL